MNYTRVFINILLLAVMPCWTYAQVAGNESGPEGVWLEGTTNETGTTLILDNSRTKVGKDFYDLFYKHWSALPNQPDTTQQHNALLATPSGDVIIMVEEIPSPGTANQILISIDDQSVWQQFVQARYDSLEEDALYAVETVREYLASYQETQQQLGSQDQKGSGIY